MMIFLDIIIGIVLIAWGIWEYKDTTNRYKNKENMGSVAHFAKTEGNILAIVLVATGLLFIFRILRIEYLI